jgi:hypothetical protein
MRAALCADIESATLFCSSKAFPRHIYGTQFLYLLTGLLSPLLLSGVKNVASLKVAWQKLSV